ncbi:hypothetical protein [Microvirga sp. KLBC 81]|uniref:hypothetical protein n=1 Tax=Microvirga sp. KLBC 81 TaxID=1862707 RepID=UPI00352E61D8
MLSGSAGLLFEDESTPKELKRGDYLLVPAGRRHRVEWTDGTEPTIWLAVHFGLSCRRAAEADNASSEPGLRSGSSLVKSDAHSSHSAHRWSGKPGLFSLTRTSGSAQGAKAP